jgi:hypothetical protein
MTPEQIHDIVMGTIAAAMETGDLIERRARRCRDARTPEMPLPPEMPQEAPPAMPPQGAPKV